MPLFGENVIKKASSSIQKDLDFTVMSSSQIHLLELEKKTGIKVTEESSIKCHSRWEF